MDITSTYERAVVRLYNLLSDELYIPQGHDLYLEYGHHESMDMNACGFIFKVSCFLDRYNFYSPQIQRLRQDFNRAPNSNLFKFQFEILIRIQQLLSKTITPTILNLDDLNHPLQTTKLINGYLKWKINHQINNPELETLLLIINSSINKYLNLGGEEIPFNINQNQNLTLYLLNN
jgi:hypothetical protein